MFDLYFIMSKWLIISIIAFVAHLKIYILGGYIVRNSQKISNFAPEKEKDCNLL